MVTRGILNLKNCKIFRILILKNCKIFRILILKTRILSYLRTKAEFSNHHFCVCKSKDSSELKFRKIFNSNEFSPMRGDGNKRNCKILRILILKTRIEFSPKRNLCFFCFFHCKSCKGKSDSYRFLVFSYSFTCVSISDS